MELIFNRYGQAGLYTTIVYTEQEYRALDALKKWDEPIFGYENPYYDKRVRPKLFYIDGSKGDHKEIGYYRVGVSPTYRLYFEPGWYVEFWGGTQFVEKYITDYQTWFRESLWRPMQHHMEGILRTQGVYKYQTIPGSNPVSATETPSNEPESFVIPGIDEAIETNAARAPRVQQTEVKLQRNGKVVRLWFNPSQEDRGIIKEFGLDKKTYDEPLYSKQELENRRKQFAQEEELIGDKHRRILLKGLHIETLKSMQQAKITKTLPDFMAWPYERVFPDNHEATQHCTVLIQMLQGVKSEIEKHKTQVTAGHIEVDRDIPTDDDDEDDDAGDYYEDDEDEE